LERGNRQRVCCGARDLRVRAAPISAAGEREAVGGILRAIDSGCVGVTVSWSDDRRYFRFGKT
jgi:hypothetical protein